MYSVEKKWSAEEPVEGFEGELEIEPEETVSEGLSLSYEAAAEESEATPPEPIQGNDPILAYLREIGSVPLLSREREVELGKQIEACRDEIFNVLFSNPLAVRYVLELGDAVAAEELELRQILERSERDEEEREEVLDPKPFLKTVAKIRRLSASQEAVRRQLNRVHVAKQRRAASSRRFVRFAKESCQFFPDLGTIRL